MAIWQYECNIVPLRHNIIGLEYEEIISWKGIKCPEYNITFLKNKSSWSKNIIQYGDLDGNCMEFLFNEMGLEEIECRLDLRNFSVIIFRSLLEYVNFINAAFWCNGNIYLPVEKNMINQIKASDAYKFCRNPIDYLENSNY